MILRTGLVLGLAAIIPTTHALPLSERNHHSAADACCACSHYLAPEPARVALCRYGPCAASGGTAGGAFCWDTVWDPSYTKASDWGSPCSSVAGWGGGSKQGKQGGKGMCWGGRSVAPLVKAADAAAAAAAGAHSSSKHAASFPPLGSFGKCSEDQAASGTAFYGTLGGAFANCGGLCRSAGGESTHWSDGADQEHYCTAIAHVFQHFAAAAVEGGGGGGGGGGDDGEAAGGTAPHVYSAPAGLAQPTFPLYDIRANKCRVNADGTAGGTLARGRDAAAAEPFRCTTAMCGFCKCKCTVADAEL